MKRIVASLIVLLTSFFAAQAQDEGDVVIKQRFERDKTVFVSFGPSFTLGKNLGDYSTGFNFEAGFLKRSNKLISWGPSISFLSFAYDESKTYPYYYDVDNDLALELAQEGGGISILSAGLNLKLSLIPVSDETLLSVYGIVNPFVSFVSREEVTENVDIYRDTNNDGIYKESRTSVVYSAEDYEALEADSKVSGGAHLGVGVEFRPAKMFSFFGQATFSYTLPVSYIATESFLKEEDKYVDADDTVYYDASETLYLDEFPIVKKGFSALSIKVGMAFNF
jgi:hypothetical protein